MRLLDDTRHNNLNFFRRVDKIRATKKRFLIISKIGKTIKTFIGEGNTIGEMEGKIKKRYPIAETQKVRVLSEDLEEI